MSDTAATQILWTGGWDSTFRVGRLVLVERRRAGGELLLEPLMTKIEAIRPDEDVTRRIREYGESMRLGTQYDWLIRYVLANGIQGMELCIHKDDKFQILVKKDNYFRDFFSCPLLEMTKLDMKRLARGNGFLDLMQKTWFCHRPYNGKPCGYCNPCRFTVKEGLGERIPLRRRLGVYLRSLIRHT